MNVLRQGLIERLVGRLNLRFPALFVLFAVLTVLDFVVPDLIPLADEIGLALLTALFALWKRRRTASPPGGATPLPPARG